MLQVQEIYKFYSGEEILSGITFRVKPREKIALIGPNGCGKTTLLRIIQGELPPDRGSIIFEEYCPVATLSQEITVKQGKTLGREMRNALPDLVAMEKRLRRMEGEMEKIPGGNPRMEEMVEQYSDLHHRFDQARGHDLEWKIDVVIQGLGFSLKDKARQVSHFSGGWQMRIELAKLLLGEMDLLLLDEPTNHLDLFAVEWLEGYLASYPGAVIIVSHDRYFLNRVTDRTLYLNRGILRDYHGNYDSFINQRNRDQQQHEKAYFLQQKKLEKDQRFIERFRYKATLASRVKSREKMIERMDLIEAPAGKDKTIKMTFQHHDRGMSTVFEMKDLARDYPGKRVPLEGKLTINHQDRIAVMGPNGCGKTTLLKILAGIMKQSQGSLRCHPHARIGYYSQNQSEQLDTSLTPMETLMKINPDASNTHLRTILGCFLFRGDDVFKPVSVLSGGEKSRLSLACLVLTPTNVLLLDEPTNHLDIDSREALASALEDYRGTVIMVSHDRYFLQQVCNRVVEILDGTLVDYPGDYEYYKFKKQQEKTRPPQTSRDITSPIKTPEYVAPVDAPINVPREKVLRGVQQRIQKAEDEIAGTEEKIDRLEAEMARPEVATDADRLLNLSADMAELHRKLEEDLKQWESLHRELEEAEGH